MWTAALRLKQDTRSVTQTHITTPPPLPPVRRVPATTAAALRLLSPVEAMAHGPAPRAAHVS